MDDCDLQGENGIVSAYCHGGEQGGKAGADISAQSECINLPEREHTRACQGYNETRGGGRRLDDHGDDGADYHSRNGSAGDRRRRDLAFPTIKVRRSFPMKVIERKIMAMPIATSTMPEITCGRELVAPVIRSTVGLVIALMKSNAATSIFPVSSSKWEM